MSLAKVFAVAAFSVTAFAPLAFAQGASDYNGVWVLDIPSSPAFSRVGYATCPGLRLPLRIAAGQVTGEVSQVPSATGGLELESGDGPNASPVTGTVSPDGIVNAQWENFRASGRLSGDTGQITVETECGPAQATATRVAS